MKKIFTFLILMCILCSAFCGCTSDKQIQLNNNEEYIAQGTIPAKAKTAPLYDENIPMTISDKFLPAEDKNCTLSYEDKFEIVQITDKYSELLCDSEISQEKLEAIDFLLGATAEEIHTNVLKNIGKTKLENTQIFTLYITGKDKAEALVYSGTILKDGKSHFDCGLITYRKMNGHWYIEGSKSQLSGLAEDYTFAHNATDGDIIAYPKGG